MLSYLANTSTWNESSITIQFWLRGYLYHQAIEKKLFTLRLESFVWKTLRVIAMFLEIGLEWNIWDSSTLICNPYRRFLSGVLSDNNVVTGSIGDMHGPEKRVWVIHFIGGEGGWLYGPAGPRVLLFCSLLNRIIFFNVHSCFWHIYLFTKAMPAICTPSSSTL